MGTPRRSRQAPLIAAFAAAVVVACSPGEQGVVQGHPDDPVIVLSEGACPKDTCPVYDMTLHPTGQYTLNSVRFVKRTGVTEGDIGAEAWIAAVRELESASFWTLKQKQTADTLSTCQPDGPDVLITWRTEAGKEKTVTYNARCGVEKMRRLIGGLRGALQFDALVWTDDQFNPETGERM